MSIPPETGGGKRGKGRPPRPPQALFKYVFLLLLLRCPEEGKVEEDGRSVTSFGSTKTIIARRQKKEPFLPPFFFSAREDIGGPPGPSIHAYVPTDRGKYLFPRPFLSDKLSPQSTCLILIF